MKIKLLVIILLFLFPIVYLSGCASWQHKNIECDNYATSTIPPTISLEYYKSVQLRENQNAELALALSISGGGHRAANFG